MFLKRYEKTDRRILSIALVLLLLCIGLISWDDWVYRLTGADLGDLEEIGQVSTVNNDVRRRHEVEFTWTPVKSSNVVYQGDSIFTGPDSGVVIRTASGQEIAVAPNSLVVVKTKKDEISIDIGFGSVEGKIADGKTLRITSNNSVTELSGKNAVVKVDAGDGKKLLLDVIAGQVNVQSADGSRALNRNDIAQIDTSGEFGSPDTKNIKILSPLANQRIRYSVEKPVEFRWQSVRKGSRAKIKIATDPEMKKTLVDTRVDDNEYTAYNLPIDVPLYWQIIADNGVSEKTDFFVVGTTPPQLVSPQNGQQIFYDAAIRGAKAGAKVDLQWAGGSPALRYEVQVASTPVFLDAKSYKTKDVRYTLGLLPTGQYYWRVKSLDFADTKWTETASFKVGPEPTQYLAAPLMAATESEFFLQTKLHKLTPEKVHLLRNRAALELVERFPTFKWSPVAGATEYDLEIAPARDFKNSIVKRRVRGTDYTWKTAQLGSYYWRIRARGELYKDGYFSGAKAIDIQLAPPQSLANAMTIDEVPERELLNAPPPPLELKWNPTLLTDSYQVQFAKTANFKDALEFFTNAATRKVQISSLGGYYWRIRSLDRKKNAISPWSEPRSIEFQRVFRDPLLSNNLLAIYPRQQDSLVIVGQGKSDVRFQWTTPYKGANYHLQISYDIDFKNIAHTAKVKGNTYVLKERLISNVVYWRVRAEEADKQTQWTGANRFLISYETTPFDYETSEMLFASRLKAKERQQELIAMAQRQLNKLRTPASTMDWQLDTPQTTYDYSEMILTPNFGPLITQKVLNAQRLDTFYSQVRTYPTFTWNKVRAAERYFIQIAHDPEFKQIVIDSPTFNTFYEWNTVRPGQYYWRVQAFNDRYTRSDYSPKKAFRVEVEAPAATSNDMFVEVFEEPREMWQAPAPFKLQWTPTLFARAYDVEISESADFKYSKTYRTDQSEYEVKVTYSGLYYWRVKALNDYGISISEWSPTRSVEAIQTTRTPASVRELTGLFPKDRTMVFVGRGEMRLPFHFVAPDKGQYKVEISDSLDFKRVLTSAVTSKEVVRITSQWPAGKLFWRVRREGVNTRSLSSEASLGGGLSKVYEFILKKEPAPYVAPPSKAAAAD